MVSFKTATEKLSPTLPLTPEQAQLIKQAQAFIQQHLTTGQTPAVLVIEGEAGTGKSVVLTHLFNDLQVAARTQPASAVYQTQNRFLVNHPEVLKVYRQLAGTQPHLLKKYFQRPTTMINQLEKHDQQLDVVLIDEAHLLLSKPDHYNNFYHENQLLELIKRSQVVVLVIDFRQVLRMKSLWTPRRLQKLLAPYPHLTLRLQQQLRMQAPASLVDWINQFTDGKIQPLPPLNQTTYDFRIFDDAEAMRQLIVKQNQRVGLARMLATSGYPSTLDGGKHYIEEGAFRLPWDQYNFTSTPWAELPASIDEVGSIYTCQGFDLNYAGIIIGPIFYQDPQTGQLAVDLSKYTDVEAFKRRADLTNPREIKQLKLTMVRNALNVILKRGVMGTYVYAHDPRLRRTLMALAAERS